MCALPVRRSHPRAIAYGVPQDVTVAALWSWLSLLGVRGLILVPVSAVVQHRMTEEKEARR
jgi:polysaccharide deacetylase 2 family uncharacterized protein YibQ